MPTYLNKKWQMRFSYTTQPTGLSILSHEHRIYVYVSSGATPGFDMSDFEVTQRNGVAVDCATYIDTYLDLVEPLMPSSTNIIRCELWAADIATEDWIFYSTLPIGHVGGAAAGAGAYLAQIITFRTADGKSLRLQYAETGVAAGAKDPYPFASAASAALAAHVASLTSAIVNKYFAYPISPINNCVEQFETYWDKRQRA